MILRALAILIAGALPLAAQEAAPTKPPERIVADLSRDDVDITTSFDGSEIIIYGAIKREAPPLATPLDVIVTVEGPALPVTVRHKERRFGIWVNTGKVAIAGPELLCRGHHPPAGKDS